MADADRIRSQYQSSLGRDASDDEVNNWLSGAYGGGGIDDWLGQIGSSGEAQAYSGQSAAPTPTLPAPTPDPTNHEYAWADDPQIPAMAEQFGIEPPAAPAPTSAPTTNPNAQAITDYYKQYLGRDPLAGDVDKWLSGAYGWGDSNNLAGIQRGIQTSEEAAKYRASTPTTSYTGVPYSGFATSGNDYSAFDTAREQNPGKSAKDAFAYISNQAPTPPFASKPAMQTWFTQYIQPGMEALGHHIVSVTADGFTYTNPEGTFFVDFAQNAGATPGSALQRLQWNATPADQATKTKYATTAAPTAPTPSTAPAPQSPQQSSASQAMAAQFATPSPLSANVQNAINSALTLGPSVDENDPTFKAQDQANRIASQRAAERARMSAVQRMHAQGQGQSGAMDSTIAAIEGQHGEADQQLNAALRSQFLQRAEQRYTQALQLGAGIMSSREEQQLRSQLAAIQAELAREDLKFRSDYAYDALGQNLGLSMAELQQRALQTMFQGG